MRTGNDCPKVCGVGATAGYHAAVACRVDAYLDGFEEETEKMTEPILNLCSEVKRKLEQKRLEKETWALAKRILEELEELDRRYKRVAKHILH